MVLSTIAAVVLFYLLVVFLLHEIFKKFFHITFFIGTALFIAALLYMVTRGG